MAKPLIDMGKFKKVSEDDQRAVLQHEAGHQIHIAKTALSKDMLKQLSSLPLHQASPEAPVASTDSGEDQSAIPGQIRSGINPPGPGIPGGPFNVSSEAFATPRMELAADVPSPAPVPEATAPLPVDPNAAVNTMPGGMELAQANSTQTAALQGQASKEASLQHAHAVQEEAIYQQTKRDLEGKRVEMEAATEDIRRGHINPNHYMESRGAGAKVATAIGLLLGGIAAGQTGHANPAFVFLNKQIENDIEAQKANLSNKHTLLSALHQQYGDSVVADNMFRAIRANTLASQVAEAAAKSASDQAKAAGLMFSGQLKQQAGQYMQLATLNQLKSGLGNASGPQMDAAANAYLQVARVRDPKGAEEFEKRYIPGVGVASVPIETKDREFIQKNHELRDLYKRAESVLAKNKGFGAVPGTSGHAEAKALQNQMQLRMGEIANLNRMTHEENKIYGETVPDLAGTHFTGKDRAKLKALMGSIDSNINTFYQQKGLKRQAGDSDSVTVLNPQGQSGKIPKAQLQQALKSGFKLVE